MTRYLFALVIIALVLAGLRPPSVGAQSGGELELPPGVEYDDVNRVARKMYCDVCEGIPLDECESIACRQWRQEIARQLGDGRTDDQVIDYFVERYGDNVAAIPRDPLDRFLAFAVPIALIALIGVAGLFQMQNLRRRGRQAGSVARRSTAPLLARPVPDDIDPRLLERLERELEGLD